MAHNLHFNETTGRHSFFSVKQKPWHDLGTIVEDYPNSAEAIRHAGLDYLVEKQTLLTGEPSHPVKVPDHYATVRTDTGAVLGVVGRHYQVVQNTDAFSFFDAIVGGDGILYETAGALGQGERIFITARLPHYIKVGREDLVEQYLFLTTSHDGTGSITAAFTPVRIVCNNTLSAALKNCSQAICIRHTAHASGRLLEAHRLMGISNQLAQGLEAIFNHWSRTPIGDAEVRRLIQLAMAPDPETLTHLREGRDSESSARFKNTCDSVFTYAMESPTQLTETTRGTLFGAYNAVTGYFQNVRTYTDREAKLRSLLLGGTAQQRTQKTFQLCSTFALKGAAALG